MKHLFLLAFLCLLSSVTFWRCRKTYELPPDIVKAGGPGLSIAQLKQRLKSLNSIYRFGETDSSITLTITMDESSGNIYKQVYAMDESGQAILLRLLSSGGLYQGDKLRLRLSGLSLICSNNMVSLDSVSVEKNTIKLSSGHAIKARAVSMAQLFTATSFRDAENLQSQYIRLSDVEFAYESRGKTFANFIARTSAEYPLGPCYGKTISVRTSGMANFAGKAIPLGHGEVNGILQQYNDVYTLILRSYGEWHLPVEPCGQPDPEDGSVYLVKDFEDKSLSSGGWLQAQSTGTTAWTCSNFAQASFYARISNKNTELFEACSTWLISPEIDLSNAIQPQLSFVTANSSTLSPLSLLVSDNYTSSLPVTSATWQSYSYAFQKSSFTFAASGPIDLQSWKGKKIRLAFRYEGTATGGSIWNLDNIVIKEP